MNIYHLEWGGWDDAGSAAVSTVEELDAVLDQVAASRDADGYSYKVGVFADDAAVGPLPIGLEITLGHPERASVLYIGPDGTGIGYHPDTPAWDGEPVWFNASGVPTDYGPDRLRLTPAQARHAAREFVRTGHRPTTVCWDEPR